MKLYIRNMVCIRCIMVVKTELAKLSLQYRAVKLGEVDVMDKMSQEQQRQLKSGLLQSGLELMDDKKSVIQNIKSVIVELVHYSDEPLMINFSHYLSEKLHYEYTYLANIFSDVQGTTIEKFLIAHKIERVKELLVYDEMNITEIACIMHYSNVAHLSNQFKKVTGVRPSCFKLLKNKRRFMLDNV